MTTTEVAHTPAPEPARPVISRSGLVLFAVGGAVVAAGLAGALGSKPSVSIAVQLTAPPPFGVLHDLRWLLVFHNSWAGFAGELAAMLAFRTGVTTVMLTAAWPADVARPPIGEIVRRAFGFTVLLTAAVLPWAVLLFAEAVAPVSWLFFVGIPSTLLVALAMHHAIGGSGWWRRTGPLRSAGWIVFAFLVLSIAAAVIAVTPFPYALVPVAATGVFNAWAWTGITSAVVRPRAERRVTVPAPVALGLVVVIVAAGVAVGFDTHSASQAIRTTPAATRVDLPVLVVSGFGSQWDGNPTARFARDDLERRFSYRGLDAAGHPLPYTPADTRRALASLVAEMDAQVRALARNVGRPVAIVAESEGALVAADYAATSPDFPVDRIVMESPLIDPARVYYPPRGRQGWGVASGWLMRGIAAAVNGLSAHQFPPDAPLFRSIVDGGPALRGLRTCPSRGARRTVLFPLADAVAAPFATTSDVDVRVVPAFHGGLLTNDAARRTILLALRGRYIARHPLLEQASVAVRAAASAWHVPPLPDALNPAWRGSKVRCAPIG